MAVKVVIDAEACIGCGLCVSSAPDAIAFDVAKLMKLLLKN